MGNNCELHIGDEIIIIGQTSGIVYSKITNINKEGYLNGILIFLNGNIMMNSNKNVYCLSKREEYAK